MKKEQIMNWITTLDPPYLALSAETEEEKEWNPHIYYKHNNSLIDNFLIRYLRGKKMRTKETLMNEFAASLQFFPGFGANWHALEDCLEEDYETWWPFNGYYLMIKDFEEVLIQEKYAIQGLLATLDSAGRSWSQPITDNDSYNRPAIPFHVLFQCEPMNFEKMIKRFEKSARHYEGGEEIPFLIFRD